MQYSIVIADDHSLIAQAIGGIIENFRNYTVLYEVQNGKILIEKFRQKKNIPEIILLDVSMPVMDGYETAQWLTDNHPEVLILALSMQDDEQALLRMIKSGAKGYLLKNCNPVELENALNALTTKGYYYSDWAAEKVFKNLSGNNKTVDQLPALTDREKEFLQLASTELTYKEIADKMFCSPRTVEGYRDDLFQKFGFKTRVGLVVFAIRNNLIQV
ncbi:response regulator transcription factor [Panacibacter sp. DH6]|uniref:Response regulator transcription factor n=1 Tax=Panacibacter microcysteis TaxID=2793269 RepID=A0A931GXR4_9BACT|nr:response regulator transcription factor [Panacibacter microcysteis]MBG9376394.1 response regulator transcription factor [Panacibacter microcysteis]